MMQGAGRPATKTFVMLSRRRLAGAAVLAALFALLASGASPVFAATPDAHGYWWNLQPSSGPTLPPPAVVPPNGLWVSSDSSGPRALSAVRYKAPTGVQIRTLVLQVYRSDGQQGGVIFACGASSGWKPAEAGQWNAAPTPSCDVAAVKGVPSADLTTWSFDVRGFTRTGTLNVVILPPADLHVAFSVSFLPPGPASVVTQTLPGSPSPSSPSSPDEGPGAGRVPSSPAQVLSEKTLPPGSPSSIVQPSVDSPSSSASAAGPLASGPEGPPTSRPLWVFGLAAALVVGVLALRTVLR